MTRRVKSAMRLAVEVLEDRTLPSVYVVDTVLDNPAGGAGDVDGLVSLREAIQAANTNAAFGDAVAGQGGGFVDTIAFDPALTGATILLGGSELNIADHLSIIGPGAGALTISGNHASGVFLMDPGLGIAFNASNLMIADASSAYGGGIYNWQGVVTLSNMVFRGNSATNGSAIYNDQGTSTIDNCVFVDNVAESDGGAITNFQGTSTIRNSAFSGNTSGSRGGAVWSNGTLEVASSTFAGNRATGNGGAIANRDGGSVAIQSSYFGGNSANSGGAVHNYGRFAGTPGALDISDSVFVGNIAGTGGAIWNDGPANLDASTLSGNQVVLFGGGIWNAGTLQITASTLSNNAARDSGAIETSFGGAVVLASSTLSGNRAERFGGEIGNFSGSVEVAGSTISGNQSGRDGGSIWSNGLLAISNATIFGNRADADGDGVGTGGGIYHGSSVLLPLLANTIVAGNAKGAPGGDAPFDIAGSLDADSSHNLIGDAGTAGGLMHGKSGNIVGNAGSGTLDIARILDPHLTDNGGPTWTHALFVGSLAVDAGLDSAAGDADQRGSLRFLDGDGDGIATVDIGAYELATVDGLMGYLQKVVQSLGDNDSGLQKETKHLLTLLAVAAANLERGNVGAATQLVQVFVNTIHQYAAKGDLPAPAADQLVGWAQSVLDALESQAGATVLDALFAALDIDLPA